MIAEYNQLKFIIEEDLPEVGFYLYVYQNEKCIRDYLQDDLAACKSFALAEFGVPLDAWQPISKESKP
jgi:hypothetical protein